MKFHHLASDGNQAVAITEAASSGGRYGHPVILSSIRFDVKNAEAVLQDLSRSGHRHEKSFEVIERWDADARNQGPNSKFGRTLAALVDEAPDHLKGVVTYEAKDMGESTMAALKALTKQTKLSQALPATSGPSMVIGGQVWSPREEASKLSTGSVPRAHQSAEKQSESPTATMEPAKQRMRL
jgi:hypothetical protein